MRWFLQMCSASGYTGGGSIIAALVRGLEKHGGRLLHSPLSPLERYD